MDSSQTPAEAVCFSLESQMTLSPILFWHPQPSVPFCQKHPKRKKKTSHKSFTFYKCLKLKHQLDCQIHDNSDSTIFLSRRGKFLLKLSKHLLPFKSCIQSHKRVIKLENLEGPGSRKMCSLCNRGTLQ